MFYAFTVLLYCPFFVLYVLYLGEGSSADGLVVAEGEGQPFVEGHAAVVVLVNFLIWGRKKSSSSEIVPFTYSTVTIKLYSNKEGQSTAVFFKILSFANLFLGSLHCTCVVHVQGLLRRRDGNISIDLSLLVLLHNTNFMNKLKFNEIFYYFL